MTAMLKRKAPIKTMIEINNEEQLAELYATSFIPTDKFFVAPGRKNHLLEHYMPGPGSVTAIISPPGGGKTTLLANIAFTYAFKGRFKQKRVDGDIETTFGEFLGLRMTQKPGPVLFIAREGHRQLQLLGAHENEVINPGSLADDRYFEPIIVMSESENIKLDIDASVKHLHAMLAAFELKHGRAPGLIILDTARKLLAGDENSSKEVTSFMQACQNIAKECNAVVLIAHHTPKSEQPTARGSGAWLADTDCEWHLKPGKKYVTVTVTKLKGFQLPAPFHFTIKPVDTSLPDSDNPGKFLSAAHIEAHTPDKEEDVGGKAADKLLQSPEAKHAARQKSRIDTMMTAWEDSGSELTTTNEPYISRAALAQHLMDCLGYTTKTAQQAMKPAANPVNKANIVGPLLTDGLIAPHGHGWKIIVASPPPAEPAATKARKFPKKRRKG